MSILQTSPLGAKWLRLDSLWQSAKGVPAKDRLTELMKAGGVQFFADAEYPCQFVSKPVVAIVGVGGIPLDKQGFDDTKVVDAFKAMMGYSASFSYVNPTDPTQMFGIVADRGEFSVSHTCSLNIIILGLSTAAEIELDTQRDLVHLSRVTVARSASQDQPPVVALYPEALPIAKQMMAATRQLLGDSEKPDHLDKQDWREAVNLFQPLSKATMVMVSGSLRGFQKLLMSINDNGKEEEYRRILAQMNESLSALFPEIFVPNDSRNFNYPPDHYA